MTPWLTTEPAPPALYQFWRSARKSRSVMERVVAKRLPTSTDAVRVNRMPFGLEKAICPFAVKRPAISDGLFPRTRKKALALELGWLTLTQAFCPIENVSAPMITL